MLNKILNDVQKRVQERQRQLPIKRLMETVEEKERPSRRPNFREVVSRSASVEVIAEIKRVSPSKGVLMTNPSVEALADAYVSGGAAGISVLTEQDHFMGQLSDMAKVRQRVECPVLQKDFFLEPYQVYESLHWGADMILLIAAVLSGAQMKRLHQIASSLGLACLWEVHSKEELQQVLEIPLSPEFDLIAINNRNLKDFSVNLKTTAFLAEEIPVPFAWISASGIRNREDLEKLGKLGASAALVGETLLMSGDPVGLLKQWRGAAQG